MNCSDHTCTAIDALMVFAMFSGGGVALMLMFVGLNSEALFKRKSQVRDEPGRCISLRGSSRCELPIGHSDPHRAFESHWSQENKNE